MNSIDWLNVIGGLGLLLFSLRFLTKVLESSVSRRFKPWVNTFFATHKRCLLVGFALTIVVQASSITIITAMGLINASLITLEQSFFVMLGSTLGTTIKAWFFSKDILVYAPALIGISSIAVLICRNALVRDLLEIVIAIGISFLGLYMLGHGFAPLLHHPMLMPILQEYNRYSLANHMVLVLTGIIFTMSVQSSTAALFLTIEIATQGGISFATGAAFILGINIGVASTALVVSIEHGTNVKRLAVAHFLVKLIGVAIVVFFFPSFLAMVNMVASCLPAELTSANHLILVHVLFNLINVIWWSFFVNLLLRMVRWLLPGEDEKENLLPPIVRRMLVNNPDLALQEFAIQAAQAKSLTKALTDYCLEMLMDNNSDKRSKKSYLAFGRGFVNVKEVMQEILVQLSRRQLPTETSSYVRSQMYFVNECEELYYHAFDLKMHIEHGIWIDHFGVPGEIKQHLPQFQTNLNQLWMAIMVQKKTASEEVQKVLKELENAYFVFLQRKENLRLEHLTWLCEIVGYLYQIVNHLENLSRTTINN